MLVISESTLALVNDGLWLCRPVSFTPGTTPDMLVVYKNGVDGYGDPNYYVVGTMTGSAFDPLTLQMQATIQWVDQSQQTLVPTEYSVVADLLGV